MFLIIASAATSSESGSSVKVRAALGREHTKENDELSQDENGNRDESSTVGDRHEESLQIL